MGEKSSEQAVSVFADMKNAVELHNVCNLRRELDRLDLKFLCFFLFLQKYTKLQVNELGDLSHSGRIKSILTISLL